MILLFIISIIILLIINLLDASYSTLVASLVVYIIGFIYSQTTNNNHKRYSISLFLIVISCYLISAYIFSLSFSNGNHFLLSDPLKYIDEFSANNVDGYKLDIYYIIDSYLVLSDDNVLHNFYIKFLSFFSKSLLDGGSILFLTLAHSLFGILSSTVLYRVLLMYFSSIKAFKYALIFSLLSVFHFYSGVIIRDIIIAYFYLLVIEIVLNKYSLKNLIKIFIILIITLGLRLYSGLFISVFILFYIYIPFKKSRFKPLLMPLYILTIIALISSLTLIIQKSIDELAFYQQFSLDRGKLSGGLSNYLLNLPIGLKQIVLTLYSQFNPFPPFAPLLSANTFSQYYMSLLILIYSIWWAYIFFPLLILLLYKGAFKKITIEFKILFFISIIFITINTAHIDVRRIMPVYPILYLIFLQLKNNIIPKFYMKRVNIVFTFFSILGLIVYIFLTA